MSQTRSSMSPWLTRRLNAKAVPEACGWVHRRKRSNEPRVDGMVVEPQRVEDKPQDGPHGDGKMAQCVVTLVFGRARRSPPGAQSRAADALTSP